MRRTTYIDNDKKNHGTITPGFDPKDAKFFWEEHLPDEKSENDPEKKEKKKS